MAVPSSETRGFVLVVAEPGSAGVCLSETWGGGGVASGPLLPLSCEDGGLPCAPVLITKSLHSLHRWGGTRLPSL